MSHLKFLIFLLLFFSIFTPNTFASESKDITIVNPIRGKDFWEHNFDILDTPKAQYDLISKNNLPTTWLIRYDALKDNRALDFLKKVNKNQELGIFLEITPSLTTDAKVKYNQNPNWHYASSILVIGYSPEDRKKLIDTVFKKFKDEFGVYPKSIGAWWIDAGSLVYMKDKYGIEASLDVSDQFSTDQYQVWGQYWSSPFYPSKVNALMPAQSKEQKIGVVMTQWAPRDPFNGYGNGVFESTFSVQANDYILHDLGVEYFEKFLNIYPHITIGLENDFDFKKFGEEYKKQIELIRTRKNQNTLSVLTMQSYAQKYLSKNPEISPNVLITADDPLGTAGKVVWYQTPRYRVGWFYNQTGSVIRDLRLLSDSLEESCLKVACKSLNLAFNSTSAIDEVNFGTRWMIDEGKISDFNIIQTKDEVEIKYQNQGGTIRTIKFLPNDIKIDEKIQPVSFAILNIVSNPQNIQKIGEEKFNSKLDFGKVISSLTINFIKFVLLTILFFLIPGWLLTKNFWISIPLGWSLFTFIAYILGYLKLDFLIWLIPALSLVFILRAKRSGVKKYSYFISKEVLHLGPLREARRTINYKSLTLIILIILGSLTWLLTQVKNGLLSNFGYGYWGPNGHDGIWHLSLISELQKNFPPNNPIFAGEALTNYHYFFDLLIAKSGQLFSIETQDLLFRFFPLVISILAGVLMYKITKTIFENLTKKDGFLAGIIATFFLYFGSSFGWIISYFRDKSFGGETMFWSQQAISTLLNPPFAISLVIFLSGFMIFLKLEDQKKWDYLPILSLAILWGTLIEFKAYAGVLVLIALSLMAFGRVIKRDFSLIPVTILSVIIAAIIFIPNNLGGSSLFVFSPLWFVTSMIDFPDRLGWQRLSLAIQSGVPFKVLFGYFIGILVFLLGNMGTRFIGLFNFKDLLKNSFLLYIFLLGIIIPLLFIQKGTNWNSVQFFYYSIFILNIFAGLSLAKFVHNFKRLGFIILLIIVILTIPNTIDTLRNQYLPNRPPAKLSIKELEALEYLRQQPEGVVMTLPFDEKLRDKFHTPIPLVAYTSTSYVAAFSKKPSFLEDIVNLEILGTDYKGRLNLQRDFAKIPDAASRILKENSITYVYIVRSQNFEEDENKMGIKKIFENEEVKIFKVN